MQFISSHNGRLLTSALPGAPTLRHRLFTTGLHALDELLPHQGFTRAAVHEILTHPRHGHARFFALLLARAAASPSGAIVWCDPGQQLYPPAVAGMGIPLDRLYLLCPKTAADQTWAIAECLRCRGVRAVVAAVERVSRIEARRFQLAAERGGGAGLLLRTLDPRTASTYAAATRWLVAPLPGQRTIQRWTVQLIHGHGGRVGQTVILEHHRETQTIQARKADPVRSPSQLADRPAAAPARASA